MNVAFIITEDSIAEHVKNSTAEDYSAGGVAIMDREYNFCIYRGELAWLTFEGKDVKDEEIRGAIFAAWCAEFM